MNAVQNTYHYYEILYQEFFQLYLKDNTFNLTYSILQKKIAEIPIIITIYDKIKLLKNKDMKFSK